MSYLEPITQTLPTHVRLVGGPPMWDGATLDHDTSDPDDLYAILQVTDGTQLPERAEGEDVNPSAVYGPIPDADHPDDLSEWYFRGWWPYSPTDPSPVQYLAAYLVRKAAQEEGPGWLDRHHRLLLEIADQAERSGDPSTAARLRQSLHT